MRHAPGRSTVRSVSRPKTAILFVMFGAALIIPHVLRAEMASGPGTEWYKCRDAALLQHDICSNGASLFGEIRCSVAYELDLLGCDADLVKALNPLGDMIPKSD